jgi:C4-dicarboxylate-specific signal transduction histidine kinase
MNKNTLLIVDDTPSNIDILVDMLFEYDIVSALNAKEALKILEVEKIDLILLDIVMPEMSGYEMCKILKKNSLTATIPVIFLSSNSAPEDIQKGFLLGAVDYVTKPFNSIELKSRIKTHLELNEYRKNLEQKIKNEIEKSKYKDEMIFHQSKLVSMGEMIQNIAHQWRQPLSQINSNVMLIEIALHYKSNVDKKEIQRQMDKIESLTKYMSNTINDFTNFFSKDKKKEKFSLYEAVMNAQVIIEGTLKHHQVAIELQIDKNISLNSYKNELQQVILVILNNAKDILLLKKIKNPKIQIKTFNKNEKIILKICDNAGGIPENILYKIFEPYFSTKHKTQGTGLGLYISRMIVEDSLDGELFAQNEENGACFSIEFKNTLL